MKVESSFKQQNIQLKNIKGLKTKGQNNKTNTPNFTGGFVPFLNFLDTSPAWGACFVDLGFMVLPRTLTDFTRGADAGVETLRREGMGTTNHSSVGLYGAAAGVALGAAINKLYKFNKNDVKANSIFADAETIDMQGKIYDRKLKEEVAADLNNNTRAGNSTIKESIKESLKQYEVLNEEGKWVRFKEADVEKTAKLLENEIKQNTNKISKDGYREARNTLISSCGFENNFRIIAEEGQKLHTSRYSIDYIIGNTYKLGKVFSKDTVKEAFINSTSIAENAFLKALKSMNMKRSLLGIGIASAVGVSTQPVNMYLTKKKTGSTKFVGGGEEDKSAKFKAKKALVAGLFGAGVLASIGHPKELIKNLQYKGFSPTIKQFKFIYGITIMSRFLSARNDNELTESTIKDTLGFANWLILGNFVQKLVAQAIDPTLLKRDGKGIMNWIKNSSLKTREEVLHSALGQKVFKDGKALSFSEMLKAVQSNSAAKKQLKALTIAQVAGYAYSGLVLGIGIPRLNIYLTNRREAKKAAKTAQNPQQADNMLKPENIAFLNQRNFTGAKLLNK